MAGPLTGVGGQQQIPLATNFQPGQNSGVSNQEVRQQNQDSQSQPENVVQPEGTSASATQNTETGNQDVTSGRQNETVVAQSSSEQQGSGGEGRGSVLDITV